MARSLITLVFVTVFAVGVAFGQVGQAVRFKVPYGFIAGSKVMPAGNYTFSLSQKESFRLTVQSDASRPFWVNIVAALNGPNELFRGGYLVFEKTGTEPILSEVWISGMDGALIHSIPKGHPRIVVSGYSLDESRTYTRKTAYNATCARCHGSDGQGSEDADKFFATRIPKLSSSEVQSKSDDDLRKQISEGSGKMPPTEIDESGFRHRLPEQDVDAVIAYVRTLKK